MATGSSIALVTALLAVFQSIPVVSDDNRLVHSAVIDASIDEVWRAFTTKEGIESWMVPLGEIELKIGGKMRTNYDPQGTIGDAHTIENTFLSYEPKRMLSFRATKAPEGFPFTTTIQSVWYVLYFDAMSSNRTRVTLIGLGYGDDEESKKMREFFDAGNAFTLDKLRKKFARPDAADEDANVLRLLRTLSTGEWIYENTRPDGTVFRSRSVVTAGPDGHSLIGQGWLGDADGMFFHGATQIWREPVSGGGGIRFQNVDQDGSVARGAIHLLDAERIRWDWDSTSLEGRLTRYRVEMSFEAADKYRFRLLWQADPDQFIERVNIVYTRIDQAPERFKKLKGDKPSDTAP